MFGLIFVELSWDNAVTQFFELFFDVSEIISHFDSLSFGLLVFELNGDILKGVFKLDCDMKIGLLEFKVFGWNFQADEWVPLWEHTRAKLRILIKLKIDSLALIAWFPAKVGQKSLLSQEFKQIVETRLNHCWILNILEWAWSRWGLGHFAKQSSIVARSKTKGMHLNWV